MSANRTNAVNRARGLAAQALLRGPLLGAWVRRKTARLVRAYGDLLLAGPAAEPAPLPPKRGPGGDPLRRLLFLCDNMWERRELLPELTRLCEVTFLDVGPHKEPGRGTAAERLRFPEVAAELRRHQSVPFDAVLVYLHGGLLSEDLLALLRQLWSGPLLGLNLDDKTMFADYRIFRTVADNYQRWAAHFDASLTNARSFVDLYRARGWPCCYLPTGFHYDPARHRWEPDAAFEFTLSFVGSCKPERAAFVEELSRRGVPIKLFGGGWDGGEFVSDGWRIYRRSQLNLGMGYNVAGTGITNLKNRDFECPGAGGCYLTTFDWELAELFEIGREILCYRGLDDFLEIYTWHARRPEACRRIAEAGWRRCAREHTWAHRFHAVFRQLGFAVPEPRPAAAD